MSREKGPRQSIEHTVLNGLAGSSELKFADHPARILIVDDELNDREFIEISLASEGFVLLTAASGEEALAMVARQPPDLILLDALMSGMDGYHVAATIKGDVATKSIPVIMVTGQNDRKARMLGLTSGAEDFLTKPVDSDELRVRVRNLLRLKAYSDAYDNYSQVLESEVGSRTADLIERTRILEQQAIILAEQAALLELAPDAIVVRDMQGRILFWNRGAETLYGWPSSEAVGRNVGELLGIKTLELNGDIELGPPRQAQWEEEAIHHKRNGMRLTVATRWALQRDPSGAPVRVLTITNDITARKLAEEKALKMNDDQVAMIAAMKERDSEMSRLNHMSDLLQACATQQEAYDMIALMAGTMFSGNSGFVAMLNSRDQCLETVARWGDEPSITSGFAINACWAMRLGQPHEVVDPGDGLICRHFAGHPAAGYMCVPLTVQGEALGLLCLIGSATDGTRGAVKLPVAVTMGEAIKLSLANLRLREKLREQATMDVLTGLSTRRYLDESLARELHGASRRKAPLCVAMLDLDQFKRFNERFGPEAGDEVLRDVGHLLRTGVRKSDIACRYDGEEFVLVLPDSSLTNTRQRMEQIRGVVKDHVFRHGDRSLGRITISAGVVQAQPEHSTASELLSAAAEALRAAKLTSSQPLPTLLMSR